MALTEKDLESIKDVLRPEFDHIDKRFDSVESRLENLEDHVDGLERTLTAAFREIVNDMYDLHSSKEEFNKLEGRVTRIEQKMH